MHNDNNDGGNQSGIDGNPNNDSSRMGLIDTYGFSS